MDRSTEKMIMFAHNYGDNMENLIEEKILKHLEDEGEVQVGPWTFWSRGMHCWHYDEEYGYCCEDQYKDAKEALVEILRYAENLSEIELLED